MSPRCFPRLWLASACVLAASPALAQPAPAAPPPSKWDFFDEKDGQLDFSNFLASGGFIPVPIIITEPAVEQGLGVAAVFLSADKPRQITRNVLAAVKTGNGSNGVGFVRAGYAFDGQLNYRVALGHGKITLNAYPPFAPGGVEYTNTYDYGVLGSAFWRLPDDRISAGPIFDFRKLVSHIAIPGLPEDFAKDFDRTLKTGALGLGLHFDGRDNPLTPTSGVNAYAEAKFNRDAFGSDREFENYDAHLYGFRRLSPALRLGYKLEYDAIRGDFPGYFAPAVNLRGVEAQRYQGMDVLSSELELTWQAGERWALVAFGGFGASDAGDRRTFSDSGDLWAGGLGFRYRIARKLGLDAGLDLAYGPEGAVFYIQFGHAWTAAMD